MDKSASLYVDTQNNLYWLFTNHPVDEELYICGFPVKRIDIRTDYKTLMSEIADSMQYCKDCVDADAARLEIKRRLKRETGWSSFSRLDRASSVIISVVKREDTYNFHAFVSKGRYALQEEFKSIPIAASIDTLADTLKEIIESYNK